MVKRNLIAAAPFSYFTTTFSLPKRSSTSLTSEVCRSQGVPLS